MTSNDIHVLFKRKWIKYTTSSILLVISSLLILFLPMILTQTDLYIDGVWTIEGKMLPIKIALCFVINIGYVTFIFKRFDKYQKRILTQWEKNLITITHNH